MNIWRPPPTPNFKRNIMLISEFRMVNNFLAHSLMSFTHVSTWALFLDVTQPPVIQIHVSNQGI